MKSLIFCKKNNKKNMHLKTSSANGSEKLMSAPRGWNFENNFFKCILLKDKFIFDSNFTFLFLSVQLTITQQSFG